MPPRPARVLIDSHESSLTKLAFADFDALLLAMGCFAASAASGCELCLYVSNRSLLALLSNGRN
jgi:hypothetical protein